jgi:hypothetical protein
MNRSVKRQGGDPARTLRNHEESDEDCDAYHSGDPSKMLVVNERIRLYFLLKSGK